MKIQDIQDQLDRKEITYKEALRKSLSTDNWRELENVGVLLSWRLGSLQEAIDDLIKRIDKLEGK